MVVSFMIRDLMGLIPRYLRFRILSEGELSPVLPFLNLIKQGIIPKYLGFRI